MTRSVTAALLGLVILGAPRPSLATSFSPYPDEASVVTANMLAIHVRALQVQLYRDEGDQRPDGSPIGPGTTNARSGAFIRRAEVGVSGRVAPHVRYLVVADLAAAPVLRDALVDLGGSPVITLRVGQFRLPFGIENQVAPHRLPFINRMLATHLAEQPDEIVGLLQEWDRGVQVLGEPISGPLNVAWTLALVNGSGLNADDTNSAKDVVGRVGLRLAGVQLGASWYRGRLADATFADRARNRTGWDIEFNPNPLKALLIRGELIRGRDDSSSRRGWYLLTSYTIADRWTAAARIERWDPDRGIGSDAITRTTIGLTHHLSGDTVLSVNYEWRDDQSHPRVGNFALAQVQVSF